MLTKHKIPPIHRTRMVNWMIEVLSNYKSTTSNETLILAI
jgi:hypothetical protein